VRPTTAVDLRRPLADVLADIEGRSQRNIRKALRETVAVRKGDLDDLDVFIKLYWETMARRHAEDWYYFGHDYFNSLFLSDRIDTELLVAEWGGEIIAGCLVMYSSKYAHYHLGASSLTHLSRRPNHLLFREMIVQAHRQGKEFLHFGGGTTGDASDSLLVFKKTFTAGQEAMFYLGQSVLDSRAYGTVCRDFLSRYNGADESGWFPLYRTPLTQLQLTDADRP
jgi:lipid II:glycine glycyltransferase (peptidoglycan interpeptide bridge formation enzyme)